MPSQLAYYEFMGYSSDALRERYAGYADLFPRGARVVDIGCGRGEFLELARERGVDAIGVDLDPDMAAFVRAKGFEVEEADGTAFLHEHERELDGVFASHVVEHLTPAGVEAFVEAAGRALRSRGRLLLAIPSSANLQMQLSEFWIDLQHVRFYRPEIMRWLLHGAGLVEIEVGENARYVSGPPEIRSLPALARGDASPVTRSALKRAADATRKALGRRLLPHLSEERLADAESRLARLEGRADLITAWMTSLYPAGEYFITGVRPEGG